jgi:hypothetical protein
VELEGKRLGNFSFNTRRVIAGCALVPCIVTLADYYLGWGLFGRFGRWVIAASFVLVVFVLRYIAPTVQEVREYRDAQRAMKGR